MRRSDTIDILDYGHLVHLDYRGALACHHGSSQWGVAAAFRALQAAAKPCSDQGLWDRRSLWITSAHPGSGVRDAIEYVTRCVTRGRYRLTDPQHEGRCGPGMRFQWWLDDERRTIAVTLRDGFVPDEFFALIERVDSEGERPDDREALARLKQRLIKRVWAEPPESLFHVTVHPRTHQTT